MPTQEEQAKLIRLGKMAEEIRSELAKMGDSPADVSLRTAADDAATTIEKAVEIRRDEIFNGWFKGAHQFRVGTLHARFLVRQLDEHNVNWRADFRQPGPNGSLSTSSGHLNWDSNTTSAGEAFERFVKLAAESGITVPQVERAACLATLK
jgi:hypothetical protein